MKVRQIRPGEESRVVGFLREVFKVPAETPAFDSAILRWKFFDPGPDWQGGRSYVLERAGEIVAHGSVWPITALTAEGEIRFVQVVDWAASPRVPGAGMVLEHELGSLADGRIGIGGSDDARALKRADQVFIRSVGDLVSYGRVVRPWQQFRQESKKTWKTAARLLRSLWRWRPSGGVPKNWIARKVEHFAESPLVDFRPRSFTVLKRSAELLHHLMRHPSGGMEAYCIDGGPGGYFALLQVGMELRIADLCVFSESPQEWAYGYALAVQTALRNKNAVVLASTAMMPLAQGALLEAKFHEAGRSPVVLSRNVAELPPLHLTPLDEDRLFFE